MTNTLIMILFGVGGLVVISFVVLVVVAMKSSAGAEDREHARHQQGQASSDVGVHTGTPWLFASGTSERDRDGDGIPDSRDPFPDQAHPHSQGHHSPSNAWGGHESGSGTDSGCSSDSGSSGGDGGGGGSD